MVDGIKSFLKVNKYTCCYVFFTCQCFYLFKYANKCIICAVFFSKSKLVLEDNIVIF